MHAHALDPTSSPSLAARLWGDTSQLATIEARMEAMCHGADDPALGRMAWEHIATGGKRLRARLAVFATQALGGRAEAGVAWGVACELLHNASLIHDDIQDGDALRRGARALWARYGVAQAINAGDLCIAMGYGALDDVPVAEASRWRLTKIVARASRRIVEGQAREMLLLASGTPPTWEDYAACVEGKTSALFALPVEGAAILAGRSMEEAEALADGCRPLGLLFQVQDDVLDLFGENGRDMRGSDLAQQGKATAFVVDHLRLHPEDRDWLLGIVQAPREETTRAQIDEAIARFAERGALASVWRRIDDIRRALATSPALAREPALHELVNRFAAEALRPVEHTRPRGR